MDSESLKMQAVLITRIFSFLMFYRAMISCKDPMETLYGCMDYRQSNFA